MQPVAPVLPLSATAKDALINIAESRFGLIPVVDDHGKLSGVVTKGSLISVLAGRWKDDEVEVST
jgi:osmoprotectant transport system ATP-binding protein